MLPKFREYFLLFVFQTHTQNTSLNQLLNNIPANVRTYQGNISSCENKSKDFKKLYPEEAYVKEK
jgi:hypothetical protein